MKWSSTSNHRYQEISCCTCTFWYLSIYLSKLEMYRLLATSLFSYVPTIVYSLDHKHKKGQHRKDRVGGQPCLLPIPSCLKSLTKSRFLIFKEKQTEYKQLSWILCQWYSDWCLLHTKGVIINYYCFVDCSTCTWCVGRWGRTWRGKRGKSWEKRSTKAKKIWQES